MLLYGMNPQTIESMEESTLDNLEQPPAEQTPSSEELALTAPRKRRRPGPLSFPKTKPSSVDLHPKRGEIERDMLRGQLTLAQIVRKYKLTPSGAQRHRK